jgi:hypothetical protein
MVRAGRQALLREIGRERIRRRDKRREDRGEHDDEDDRRADKGGWRPQDATARVL